MTFTCTAARDAILEHRGLARPDDFELRAHLDACVECASFAHRAGALAAALSTLPRRAAPHELAGLVVAATQAGHREDRVVRTLSALSRLPAPSALDAIALREARIGPRAPDVLERLVDEDLRDPAAALSRRFTGRLDRRRAPGALGERLSRSAWTRLQSRGRRRVLSLAAGAALLAMAGTWFFGRIPHGTPADDGFEVVYESSLESMDPMARAFLSSLSGGVVDVGARDGARTDGGGR